MVHEEQNCDCFALTVNPRLQERSASEKEKLNFHFESIAMSPNRTSFSSRSLHRWMSFLYLLKVKSATYVRRLVQYLVEVPFSDEVLKWFSHQHMKSLLTYKKIASSIHWNRLSRKPAVFRCRTIPQLESYLKKVIAFDRRFLPAIETSCPVSQGWLNPKMLVMFQPCFLHQFWTTSLSSKSMKNRLILKLWSYVQLQLFV